MVANEERTGTNALRPLVARGLEVVDPVGDLDKLRGEAAVEWVG
jgi:hypothetical protein